MTAHCLFIYSWVLFFWFEDSLFNCKFRRITVCYSTQPLLCIKAIKWYRELLYRHEVLPLLCNSFHSYITFSHTNKVL